MKNKILIISGCSYMDGWNYQEEVVTSTNDKDYQLGECKKLTQYYSVPSLFTVNYPGITVIHAGGSGHSNETALYHTYHHLRENGINVDILKESDVVYFHAITSFERVDDTRYLPCADSYVGSKSIRFPELTFDVEFENLVGAIIGPDNNADNTAQALSMMLAFCSQSNIDFYTGVSFDCRLADIHNHKLLSWVDKNRFMNTEVGYKTFVEHLFNLDNPGKEYPGVHDPMMFREINDHIPTYMYYDGHPNVAGTYMMFKEIEKFLKLRRPDFLEKQ